MTLLHCIAMHWLVAVVLVFACCDVVIGQQPGQPDFKRTFNIGLQAGRDNRLDDAIAAFELCLRLRPREPYAAYNLACAYSRKGNTTKAVEWLERAADWGYEDVAHLMADSNLTEIRSHPAYRSVIEGIQSRAPAGSQKAQRPRDSGLEQVPELVVMLRSEVGSGAGIILGRSGGRVYIATANHTVRKGSLEAHNIEVQLKRVGGHWFKASLRASVGMPELDLAIVAVELAPLKLNFCALPLGLAGDVNELRRGDPVYPLGYPNGILWTMPLTPDRVSQTSEEEIRFESQFIRIGFSGGALLNAHGEIMGMITADEPPLGRALPLELIVRTARQAGYPVQLSTPKERAGRPLHAAAKAGNVAELHRLIEDCIDPNTADEAGRTALHEAAAQGAVEAVRTLTAAGARPNVWAVIALEPDRWELEWGTPLHFAAKAGAVEVVKALLLAGADAGLHTLSRFRPSSIPSQIQPGRTPLHFTGEHDAVDVAALLLAAGAAVNARDHHRQTPLHAAAASASAWTCGLLIQKGAVVGARDKFGKAPLHIAAGFERPHSAEVLLSSGADPDITDEGARTPLHMAAENGSTAVAKLLLAHGANRNAINRAGLTPIALAAQSGRADTLKVLVTAKPDLSTGHPLHRALAKRKVEAARVLVEAGADLTLRNTGGSQPLGNTGGSQPLHVAVQAGQAEAVQLLLTAGAPVNDLTTGDYSFTALYLAATEGFVEIVDLLLRANADVEQRVNGNRTVLQWVIERVDENTRPSDRVVQIVERLLRAGANPNVDSGYGTPVHWVSRRGPVEILELLLNSGGNPNTVSVRAHVQPESPLHAAAASGNLGKVQLLLKAGASVTVHLSDGRTPLHAAIQGGRNASSVIEALLNAGLPIDVRDSAQATLLHLAAATLNIAAIKTLLARGASINATAQCGTTPLWYALDQSFREDEQLVMANILVNAGADVNVTNSCKRETLLEMVQRQGLLRVRQFLLSK